MQHNVFFFFFKLCVCVCMQECEGQPCADLCRRPGIPVWPEEHLQPDPQRPESTCRPRLPPVQHKRPALAEPRGTAAGM